VTKAISISGEKMAIAIHGHNFKMNRVVWECVVHRMAFVEMLLAGRQPVIHIQQVVIGHEHLIIRLVIHEE
jgi:hypothetical protein